MTQTHLILRWGHVSPIINDTMFSLRRLLSLFFVSLIAMTTEAKTEYDTFDCDIHELFSSKKTKYFLRYIHHFNDTLFVPNGSEICFEGGQLSGPIAFDKTKLSGDVNLKGSSVRGTLRNNTFDASWLCVMDGVTDDAPRINEMIEVCGNVLFPKGTYRLASEYNPQGRVSEANFDAIKCHIGINRSNVNLRGEEGTVFLTDKLLGTLCIFTLPNQIENSINNIKIENITFSVRNDAQHFNQFMHTIKTMGVKGLIIKDCVFDDFWGDAICLSHYGDNPSTGERSRNQDIKILNNRIVGGDHHNNRNGISVINGKNVLIKGNTIRNTSRKDMPGGIDIEPNNSAYTVENIRIENNTIEGVWGNAGAISIISNNNGPAHNICIKGNRICKSSKGILLYITSENVTNNISIQNNYVANDTTPYYCFGKGSSKNWKILGNTFEGHQPQKIPGNIKVSLLNVRNNRITQ